MSHHRDKLIDLICLSIFGYIAKQGEDQEPSVFEILGALDAVQCEVTEKLIEEHPELVPDLSTIMELYQLRIKPNG